MSTSSMKRDIRRFNHVVVVQWTPQRNVLKSVMHVQTAVLLIKPIVFEVVVVVVVVVVA